MIPLMITSRRGINLIKTFERLDTGAYYDIGGVLTIGYGHTGDDVYLGQIITPEEAEALLVKDVERFERCVMRAVTVPMNQNQFDAFVALAYNIGCSAFEESTLLRRFNDGEPTERVTEAWAWWKKVKGEVVPGLVRRRRAEIDLFTQSV